MKRENAKSGSTSRRILPEALQALLHSEERIVAFRPSLAHICDGDQLAGLFLSQCLFWIQRTLDLEGWFYKSQKDWHVELCLTRHQLDGVRTRLKSKGFLEEKRRGNGPPLLHYRLNLYAIESAIARFVENRQFDDPICRRVANEFAAKEQFNLPGTGNSYKESRDDDKDDSKEEVFRPEEPTRNERDRRSLYADARKRGLRDLERHPPEPWESPLSDRERALLETKSKKIAATESEMQRLLLQAVGPQAKSSHTNISRVEEQTLSS
jgi:hypothetical protein